MMHPITLSFLCLFLPVRVRGAQARMMSIDEIMETSTKTLPVNPNGEELKVHVGFYLESIGNFRSSEMSFDVDLYVYMSWKDSRLAHNRSEYVLINDVKIRNQMWIPDLYFANARQARFQEVTVPNFSMFVSRDGTVAYSCRATCSISCSLELVNYPMDQQHCYIRLLSYAYVAEEVRVIWFTHDAIRYNSEIGLPEFRITKVNEGYCDGNYRYALTETTHREGNFSCLTGNIHLSRSIGYNLVQSYIPTGLIVMISWVSFWIDRRAVPARVTLSFTTLVSLTTLGNGLRFGLPQVSYAKAIDLWYGACLVFVFCALLEFALINNYMRKSAKYEHISKTFNPKVAALLKNIKPLRPREQDFEPPIYKLGDGSNPNNFRKPNSATRNRAVNTSYHCAVNNNSFPLRNGSGTTAPNTDSARSKDIQDSYSTNQSLYDNVTPKKHKHRLDDFDEECEPMFTQFFDSDDDMPSNMRKAVKSTEKNTSAFYANLSRECSRKALKIDKGCRYGFPTGFLLFNLVYWWWYLIVQKEDVNSV